MLIKFIKKHCKSRTIHLDGNPYLTRYYIFSNRFFGLFLHHFHRSDFDRDLHNHPWAFAISYILSGGYTEVKLARGFEPAVYNKGNFNFISGSCFHRIAIITPNLYTLFFRGPRNKKWGFLRIDGTSVIFEVNYE